MQSEECRVQSFGNFSARRKVIYRHYSFFIIHSSFFIEFVGRQPLPTTDHCLLPNLLQYRQEEAHRNKSNSRGNSAVKEEVRKAMFLWRLENTLLKSYTSFYC